MINNKLIYLFICIASISFNIDLITFIHNRIKGWNTYNYIKKFYAISLSFSFISFEIILLYIVLNMYYGIKLMKVFNI